jgi:hypothetical protein
LWWRNCLEPQRQHCSFAGCCLQKRPMSFHETATMCETVHTLRHHHGPGGMVSAHGAMRLTASSPS